MPVRRRCPGTAICVAPPCAPRSGAFHLRPFGQACIEGFFGGRFAQELEDAGDGALAAQAIDEIVALLGSDYRRRLKPLAKSRWAHDPFARGSYSHALPGHAGARAVLAAPVDGRLFFAGEATSPNFFSTAHGATGFRGDSGAGGDGGDCGTLIVSRHSGAMRLHRTTTCNCTRRIARFPDAQLRI